MGAERAMCPNCGHTLTKFRTDRRSMGQRQVELEWVICMHCRHVALRSWSFVEPGTAERVPAYRGNSGDEA
jgi:hypothetical protein